MTRSVEKARRAGGAITLMVFLGALTTTSSFAPAASSAFLGGTNGALRRARLVPKAATGATALTATSMRSRTNLWQRRVRDGLGMRGAIRLKRSWGAGMWDKFTSPPAGRAHDEVTFRSGCEGRTLTIPQGSPLLSMSVDFFPFFLVVVVVVVFTNSSFCERPRCSS